MLENATFAARARVVELDVSYRKLTLRPASSTLLLFELRLTNLD